MQNILMLGLCFACTNTASPDYQQSPCCSSESKCG